ncbi:MAG: GNAT family N-acetyltransferase [Rhodothalassiaceae bacterium]
MATPQAAWTAAEVTIREAGDADAPGVIALIDSCFSDYDGCVMDLPGLDADLPAVASHFREQGGRFWIAESGGRIVGCAGYVPVDRNAVELKRLYVARAARRQGLASRLLALVRDAARTHGARHIDLWSDTRFVEAHAFYLANGFVQTGAMRKLDDPSNTTEYAFRGPVDVR